MHSNKQFVTTVSTDPMQQILAARIIGYGIDTPPEPGPSLEVYDQTFLNGMNKGEEAVRS